MQRKPLRENLPNPSSARRFGAGCGQAGRAGRPGRRAGSGREAPRQRGTDGASPLRVRRAGGQAWCGLAGGAHGGAAGYSALNVALPLSTHCALSFSVMPCGPH